MDGDYYGDEELYESEEDELELEGSESAAQLGAGDPEDDNDDEYENATEWQGSSSIPEESWKRIDKALGKLLDAGQNELTVLVLGSVGAGCSSTVNSLLAENVADVRSTPSGVSQPAAQIGVYTRRIEKCEMLLRVVDCPHLISGDTLDAAAVEELLSVPASSNVDVVLYVDRLDVFRVLPSDRQMWEAMRRLLGGKVWRHTVTCLTHGNITPPAGRQIADVVAKRGAQVAAGQRSCGAKGKLPFVVIDNASRCPTNACGERVLNDGTVWLAALWETVVERALQVALKVMVLDRVVEEDGWRGDKNGEYDAETQREQRLLAETRRMHAQEEGRVRGKLAERRRPLREDVDMDMAGDPSLDDGFDDEDY